MDEKDIHDSESASLNSGFRVPTEAETNTDKKSYETQNVKHQAQSVSLLEESGTDDNKADKNVEMNILKGACSDIVSGNKENSADVLDESDRMDVNEGAIDQPAGVMTSSASSVSSSVRVKMLARVSLSDAHFKHQQRGEPDLTMDEKIDIAQKVLDESEAKFLSRFGDYLELEDLEYFKDSMDVYEVNFYVNQIRKSKGTNFHRNRVKNRRFEAMKDLMDKGDYFSEDEMKYREPYLYQQLVGQYLTDDEIQAKVDKSDLRFSTILLKHIDQLNENARYAVSKDREEGQEEEEEESDEEDDKDDDSKEMEMDDDKSNDEDKPQISACQKEELKAEFLTIMQQKFLQGDDKAFDYSTVDNNEAYDDLNVLDLEAQEKYFDDEDAASIHSESQ